MRATTGSKLPDDQPFLCTGRGVKGERSESEGHERALEAATRTQIIRRREVPARKGRWPDE